MTPAPRALVRKSLLAFAAALVLFVSCLEIGSRVADRIVAPRIAAGEYGPDRQELTPPRDVWERAAFATLDPGAKRVQDARTVPHPHLGYCLKPGFRTAPGAAQQCSHNSLGFRGEETTWEKPAGVYRIVTLGGSSVYGQSESSDEAVWSRRLQLRLNEARPRGAVEVVNAGCSGWTSFEMLVDLELRLVDLAPDLLVLYETVNDMRAALYTAAAPEPARDNVHWRSTWPVDRPSALEGALERSRAYLIWRRYMTDHWKARVDLGYYALANYAPDRDDLYCRWPDGKVPERGFLNYERNLGNMLAIAERAGCRVLIATQALMTWDMPGRECADVQLASFRRIQDIQREVARERSVDLAETGREIEAEEERVFRATGRHLFKNDVHPFDEGSELIARAVGDAILRLGLLDRGR